MAHLVFIHGIGNKPDGAELLKIWRRVLARDEGDDPGVRLSARGINSSIIYWADVMYDTPDADIASHESLDDAPLSGVPDDIDQTLQEDVTGAREEAWLAEFEEAYGIANDGPEAELVEDLQDGLERIPLPWAIKRPFMKLLARDTHHYLFDADHSPRPGQNYKVREEIRNRFVATLKAAAKDGGPLVVMAHSQGTVVTYDCLKNVPDCPEIDALITVGSPLGLDEVQDKLSPGYSATEGFPAERVRGTWHNVFDPLDIVSRPDPWLENDFGSADGRKVVDIVQRNDGLWRHSMTKYLAGKKLRNVVREAFGMAKEGS